MTDSKVFFMDAHSESTETSLVAKMVTVFDAAGLDEIIKPNDMVAIKVHCGEWNNSAYHGSYRRSIEESRYRRPVQARQAKRTYGRPSQIWLWRRCGIPS